MYKKKKVCIRAKEIWAFLKAIIHRGRRLWDGWSGSRVSSIPQAERWYCRHCFKCSLGQVCSLQTVHLAKLLIGKLFLK